MSKHTNKNLCLWLSARTFPSEDKPFIQVGKSLMTSKAYIALNPTARNVYFAMCMSCGGKREFTFTHSAAKSFGFAKTSFERAVKELIEHKFIEIVEDEQRLQYASNKYRFSYEWKTNSHPETGN